MMTSHRVEVHVYNTTCQHHLSNCCNGKGVGLCISLTMMITLRQDQSGQSGLSCAVNVVLHILEPSQSEYACSFVGRLIITLIKQVSVILIIAHH